MELHSNIFLRRKKIEQIAYDLLSAISLRLLKLLYNSPREFLLSVFGLDRQTKSGYFSMRILLPSKDLEDRFRASAARGRHHAGRLHVLLRPLLEELPSPKMYVE